MSYRAGVGAGLARLLGREAAGPRIICDVCGKERVIAGVPPTWLIEGRAVPRWKMSLDTDGRRDVCNQCNKETKCT